MLTIIILLILTFAFYRGYRRGLLLQAIRLLGYIISFVLATKYFEPLSEVVEMLVPFPSVQPDSQMAIYGEYASFYLDQAFYRVLTFLLIALIGWVITNFLSIFFQRLAYYPFYQYVNGIGGGVINLIVTYVLIFICLFILSLVPIEGIQQIFVDNPPLYAMVTRTPFLSSFAVEMWLTVNPFQ